MTTDRELLELAAKAAGMNTNVNDGWVWCENVGPSKIHGLWRGISYPTKENPNPRLRPMLWNPLEVDGDALRLAVALHINVRHLRFHTANSSVQCGLGMDWLDEHLCGDDPLPATRRAIVRAAAEIGKTL